VSDRNESVGSDCSFTLPDYTILTTANDNCGIATVTQSPLAGSIYIGHNTTQLITLTATDIHGKTSSTSFIITLKDGTPPSINCPKPVQVSCSDDKSATALQMFATAIDNCTDEDDIKITYTDASNQNANAANAGHYNYTITRTWKAEDLAGNSSTCEQTITVVDETAPQITCPENITINCNASSAPANTGTATATDNCASVANIAITKDDVSTQDPDASKIGHYNYTITRTWRATDVAGNSTTCVQTITVHDVTAPTFTAPAETTVYTGADCSYDISITAAGDVTNELDNCASGLEATYQDENVAGSCQGAREITRTWTLTDVAGNSTEHVQLIHVRDNTKPTFTRPADITIYTTANCSHDASIAITGDVTNEADNCSTGLEATYSDIVTNGACEGSKVIKRTWHLVDNCNNAAVDQVQTITVSDNTAPTFTRPADIIIYSTANCTYNALPAVTGDVTNEADNCSTGLNATYTDVTVNGSCQGEKIITRTWHLTDKCGNAAADQVQTITVRDNIAPTFTKPADKTIYSDADCNYNASPSVTGDVTNEADNCSTGLNATYTDVVSDGDCAGKKIITRTWHLEDKCGNAAADQVQIITVLDTIAPVITVPGNITRTYDPATCNDVVEYTVSANDNCNGMVTAVMIEGLTSGSHFPVGTTTVKYQATDACGNVSTRQFTVTINAATVNASLTVTSVSPAPAAINGKPAQQYSDKVTLKVDITNGASTCGTDAATGVIFKIGNQVMNDIDAATNQPIPVSFTESGTTLSASLTVALLEKITGEFKPSASIAKIVSAQLVGNTNSLLPVTNPANKDLYITKEDARAEYTGVQFARTTNLNAGSVSISLKASIFDISSPQVGTETPEAPAVLEANPGDISNAWARFKIEQVVNTGTGSITYTAWKKVTLPDATNKTIGGISDEWTANIGSDDSRSYKIYIQVGGCTGGDNTGLINSYYERCLSAEDGLLTVSKPLADFVTGGATIIQPKAYPQGNPGMYGSLTPDLNSKVRIGLGVKYNKSGKNIQGSVHIFFKRTATAPDICNLVIGVVREYRIKTNALVSLAVNNPTPTTGNATFVAKCNITDVTDPLNECTVLSNLTLEIKMTDNGESSGTNDKIAITLRDGNTILFSNNWNGANTVEQQISSGNLVVSGGSNVPAARISTSTASPEVDQPTTISKFDLKATPNPTTSRFNVKLESPNTKDPMTLKVIDLSGKVIEVRNNLVAGQTLQLGNNYRPGMYFVELIQGDKRRIVKLVKQPD
jgi:hypothetical protein